VPQVAGLDDQAVAKLEGDYTDACRLSILISTAIQKEADRVLVFPGEFAELLQAQKRLDSLIERTVKLLEDRKQKLAEKNAPPKETQFQKVLREYAERRKKEEEEDRLYKARREQNLDR
jgi:hypothetical protein